VPLPAQELIVSFGAPVRQAATSAASVQVPGALFAAGASTDWVAWALRGWAAGALLAFGALVIGFARLFRLSSSARAISTGTWPAQAEAIRLELGLTRPVTLLESADSNLLVVWGVRRPRILLPVAARDWPLARIRIVLYHELSHIRRGDWIVQCVAEAVRAIHWFNPLTWAACVRLRRESDHAADDAVLSGGIAGPDYATHLVDIAHALRARRRWAPAPAMAHTSGFERRVQAMLDERINRRPVSRRATAIAVMACLAAAVPIAVATAGQALASFTGRVVDPTNALLPGAVITLTNTQTKARYEVTTNREGRYEIPGIPPGQYVMESQLPGFAPLKWEVTVSGQNIDRDLTLELGRLQETITVGAGGGWGPPRAKDPDQDARIEAYKKKLAAQEANCASKPATTGLEIGGNIRTPSKLRDVRPVYPAALATSGVSGTVVLDAVIGTEGLVDETRVVSASHPDFAAALTDAVKQWQFSPTLLNCSKVEVKMTVTGNFSYRP
jgi:TonB family protein